MPIAESALKGYSIEVRDGRIGSVDRFLFGSRDKVKASPPWNQVDLIEQVFERRLHEHCGRSGYRW